MSRGEPRDIPRRRQPSGKTLKIITSAPVVIERDLQACGVFSYTDGEWVRVVAAHPSCNQHKLLVDLERAGQQYRTSRRDRSSSRLALRQALVLDALQAWTTATGDAALKFSRVGKKPTGPLIRFLDAALVPILGKDDMVGHETLARVICSVRPPRKSG
jgi:hypothetical protein